MTTGVMQEIRERLNAGQSSGEVIAEGYAPPTVYKVQRRLREETSSRTVMAPTLPSAAAAARVEELETQLRDLEDLVASLEDEASELKDADSQLTQARSRMAEMETASVEAVRRADVLDSQLHEANARIHELELRAFEAAKLRHAVAESQARVQQVVTSEAGLRREAIGWQRQYEAERTAREKAEQQWTAWEAEAGRLVRQNEMLNEQVAELKPLGVWSGHPCKVCHKPMAGVVARQSAAKVMEEFGHKDCLKQNSGSPFALVAAAAGVYGLSKLR